MENITFEVLNSLFSRTRLSPYLETGERAELVLSKYHANIILSEAMIPTIHYLEVCLRTRIDQVLEKYYTRNWLMKPSQDFITSQKDLKKIEEISLKFRRENKRDPTHDDIVAQMTFGFWCSFFHRKYDPVIWHRKNAIKMVFPNLSRPHRKRSYIEAKVLKIKELRNRIAHYEPVWKSKISILSAHEMCHELIQAMSQEARNMLKSIDRFPEVYRGIQKLPNLSILR